MAKANKLVQATDWEVEEDLRTLQRAQEIKSDPARWKRAKELAKKRLEEIAQVAGEAGAA